MDSGILVILVLLAVGIVITVIRHRKLKSDTDGRYLIQRDGIAGLHCHPSIPREVAERMADLLLQVYRETWPVVRDTYADACRERGKRVPDQLPRWHTTSLEPGQFPDGRHTAYGVSSGKWVLAVGCPTVQLAEEIHSGMRGYLGDDVYYNHSLFTTEGVTVSGWIRERWGDIS